MRVFYLDRRNVLKHSSDWSNDFSYEGFEDTNNNHEILGDAHEALNRFYQKETRRSKAVKPKKPYWQENREY